MNTKSILYHLLLSYSLKELIDGNVFHCKIDYKAIKKSSDSILTSFKKSATPRQMDDIKRILNVINEKSQDLTKVSWEMMAIIAINWLVNEEEETFAKSRFMHLPIYTIMDKFNKSYKEDFNRHCDFFESIVENIK